MEKKLSGLCERVFPKIWIVHAENQGKFPFSLSFLIQGEENILLDAGCGTDRLEALHRILPIHRVILTHTHPDHAAGTWIFEGASILCPAETPEGVSDIDQLAVRYTGGGQAGEQWKAFVRSVMNFRPPRPTGRFQDGELLVEANNLRLRAVHTPGHARDHYVFFEETRGVLFSADIDFTPFGPWYGHRESSIPRFRASLQRIRELPVQAVLSSHRGLIRENIQGEIDRFEQGFEQHRNMLRSVLGEAGVPKSMEDLLDASPFYQNTFKDLLFMRKFEEWIIRHLLEEMTAEGEVAAERKEKDGPADGPAYRLLR